MPDYILLQSGKMNERVRVVVHTAIPITGPNSKNAVQVKWQDAIVGHAPLYKEPLGTTSVVPISFLPSGRQAELDDGSVWESEFWVDDSAKLDPQVRLANIEAAVAQHSTDELVLLQNLLNYYGKTGSV